MAVGVACQAQSKSFHTCEAFAWPLLYGLWFCSDDARFDGDCGGEQSVAHLARGHLCIQHLLRNMFLPDRPLCCFCAGSQKTFMTNDGRVVYVARTWQSIGRNIWW